MRKINNNFMNFSNKMSGQTSCEKFHIFKIELLYFGEIAVFQQTRKILPLLCPVSSLMVIVKRT